MYRTPHLRHIMLRPRYLLCYCDSGPKSVKEILAKRGSRQEAVPDDISLHSKGTLRNDVTNRTAIKAQRPSRSEAQVLSLIKQIVHSLSFEWVCEIIFVVIGFLLSFAEWEVNLM